MCCLELGGKDRLKVHGGSIGGAVATGDGEGVMLLNSRGSQVCWPNAAIWSKCHNLHTSRWTDAADMEGWFPARTSVCMKQAHMRSILTLWCIGKQRNAEIFMNTRKSAQFVAVEISEECSALARGKVLSSSIGSSSLSE